VQKTFVPVFNLGDDFPVDGSQFDRLFDDGESLLLGGLQIEVIATPGHTSDSVSYRIGDALFVGDSLFMPDGGTARCDFPGGDAATLFASIRRLYQLPDATRVFVCHDYGPGGRAVAGETSIGAEKAGNIHLRDNTSEAEFVALRQARDSTLEMPALILPAVQLNIRAGEFPPPEDNGVRYLKIPLDTL
jgi:glyoxylase-like metal-dependent hydrolase (beta-lactamase superfamily II)